MRIRKNQSAGTLLRSRWLGMILLCLLLMGSSISVSAATENYQLDDQAGLLTQSEAEDIEEMIEELEDKTGWDVMAVTTDDAEGMNAEYYAEKWFDDYTTSDDGILCLIDMDNREIQYKTFGEAIYYLTDDRWQGIVDDAYEYVSDGDYYGTFETMLEETDYYYNAGIPSGQYTYDEDTYEVVRYSDTHRGITVTEALIAVVVALAAGGITVGGIIGSYRLKFGGYKYPIEKNGSVNLRRKEDAFVNQFVTHRHIPKSNGSGGSSGSGRSTVHTGAGGRSSGGGGRKF